MKTHQAMKQLTLAVLIVVSHLVLAQGPEGKLLKDIVAFNGDKMTATDYTMVNYSNGNSLQIKVYAEAPSSGAISRDNFVSIFAAVMTELLFELKKSDPQAKTKDLEDLIGNADVEMNVFMTKGGIQVETKSSQGVNRKTMQWADVFK